MTILHNQLTIVLMVFCLGITSCDQAPHVDALPPIAPQASIQTQLFSAIETNNEGKALALAKQHPTELAAPFSYGRNAQMTPLQFALAKKKYPIAQTLLSNFDIKNLNPWHRAMGKSAVTTLLNIPKDQNEKLNKWLPNFIKSGDTEQVKYLLADGDTHKELQADSKIFKLIKNRPELTKPSITNNALHPTKPIGIKNTGNSCYANSAMQLLMKMPDEFWSSAQKKFFNDKGAVGKGIITKQQKQFLEKVLGFRTTWTSGAASALALGEKLREVINTGVDQQIYSFRGKFEQEDSHEFFIRMWELLRDTSFPSFHLIKHIEFVHKKVPGSSISKDPSLNEIELPLALDTKESTLQTLIEKYFETEKLTGENQYSYQGAKIDADLYLRLGGNTDYIPVLLKRFFTDQISNKTFKIHTEFDFKDGKIDLTRFIEPKPKDKQIFEVIGIAMHSGEISGGHYTARVKYENTWYDANDESILPTTWEEVRETAKNHAYLMIFKRGKI